MFESDKTRNSSTTNNKDRNDEEDNDALHSHLHRRHPQLKLDDQQAVDTALAEELNKMSVQERELIYEQIHGVDTMTPETPEFVQGCLDEMELEIQRIPVKPAYDLAESMSKEYVTDSKFRLMFLRCDNFDCKKAAVRLVKFLQGKLKHFGQHTLVRSLLLSDLNDGDGSMEALESGCYQWLPSRDRSGRIVFLDLYNMIPKTWKRGLNLVKVSIYMIMAAMEDEESQRRGVVSIMYHMGTSAELDSEIQKEGSAAIEFLPLKIACVHMCFGNRWVNAYARALLSICGPDYRARVRLHSGSHTEVQYGLMTFGLPMDAFPVTIEGQIRKTNVKKWIAKRKWKEDLTLLKDTPPMNTTTTTTTAPVPSLNSNNNDNNSNKKVIDLPCQRDVLVGKGKPFQSHAGNVRLRAIVESFIDQYAVSKRGEKAKMVEMVVRMIQKDGGRFLRRETTDWWVEVEDHEALEKVGKLFTWTKAYGKKAKRKKTTTTESTDTNLGQYSNMRSEDVIMNSQKKKPRTGLFHQCCSPTNQVPVDM